jgi:AcrR family transcriptional regulator
MASEVPRRRQARGQRRMEQILDAAAVVLAQVGYEKASTNAIAAAAGISPGSLYQYFGNKEAIAEALATRFVEGMRDAHAEAFDATDLAALTIPEVVDRVVDPIIAFNLANPGFKALFARPDMPSSLAAAAGPIQDALLGRVGTMLAQRLPGRAEPDLDRVARMLIQVFQATVPMVVAAPDPERPAVIAELKKLLGGYLESLERS